MIIIRSFKRVRMCSKSTRMHTYIQIVFFLCSRLNNKKNNENLSHLYRIDGFSCYRSRHTVNNNRLGFYSYFPIYDRSIRPVPLTQSVKIGRTTVRSEIEKERFSSRKLHEKTLWRTDRGRVVLFDE